MKIGNANGVRDKYAPRIAQVVECGEEGPTQQHFKDSCDINRIAGNIEATGSAEGVRAAQERYGNFEDIMDVAGNLDKAAKAQQLFEHIPVHIRKKVGHSIEGFFDYISKEENVDECIKLGIFEKRKELSNPADSKVAPQATKTGKLKKTTTIVEEPAEE